MHCGFRFGDLVMESVATRSARALFNVRMVVKAPCRLPLHELKNGPCALYCLSAIAGCWSALRFA